MGWRCYQKRWSHLCLGLDGDIFTQTNLLSAPQPPHRPPAATHSPRPSPNSVRLTFTDVSYKFPQPPILTPWFLHPSNLVRLILRFKPVFVVWHVASYTVDVRRRARAPVSAVQSLPIGRLAACHHQAQRFTLGLCSCFATQLHCPHHSSSRLGKTHPTLPLILMSRFTKLTTTRANPIQNSTREDPLKSSPSPPRHTKTLTP